ncbi:hypothetical protein [Fibrella forsythiae]|uniref:Uncharacterized protein n=1 Tax=Fibrella forsythiae TaxID=2817061 RepID=A0ABS3JBG7_9BACT|nr:hypothetical protein [Fibrella forsythiae]MBO0947328.1 hypothetical protein [Fibrella forsythiae]
MITELVFPYSTPSLNDTKGEHWRTKTRRRNKYEKRIWALTRNKHPGRVRVEIYRHCKRKYDHDNFVGGAKDLIDALKNQKVIVDDTEAIIGKPHYEQITLIGRQPIMTVVRIIDLPEPEL